MCINLCTIIVFLRRSLLVILLLWIISDASAGALFRLPLTLIENRNIPGIWSVFLPKLYRIDWLGGRMIALLLIWLLFWNGHFYMRRNYHTFKPTGLRELGLITTFLLLQLCAPYISFVSLPVRIAFNMGHFRSIASVLEKTNWERVDSALLGKERLVLDWGRSSGGIRKFMFIPTTPYSVGQKCGYWLRLDTQENSIEFSLANEEACQLWYRMHNKVADSLVLPHGWSVTCGSAMDSTQGNRMSNSSPIVEP
jgi:hypothetical protein